MIVETLLIAAMTAFHFAIMPGSFGPNLFVEDMIFSTKRIKNVNTFRILCSVTIDVRLEGKEKGERVC